MKTIRFYLFLHIAIVMAALYFSSRAEFLPVWFGVILVLPLFGIVFQNLRQQCHLITIRILLPISIGLLAVSIYDALPTFFDGDSAFMTIGNFGLQRELPSGVPFEFEVDSFYLEAISVLYAMFAAFLLFKGLQDHDELKGAMSSEAATLASLEQYSRYFGGAETDRDTQLGRDLRQLLCDYITCMLANRHAMPTPHNDGVIRKCMDMCAHFDVDSEKEQVALEGLMTGLNELSVVRNRRHNAMSNKMPPLVMGFVGLMSLSLLLPFYGNPPSDLSITHIYMFLMASCFGFVHMLLIDLSSPFEGYWQIKSDALQLVFDRMFEGQDINDLAPDGQGAAIHGRPAPAS